MPCNSDYLEPREDEKLSQKFAEYLIWLLTKRRKVVPPWVRETAKDSYGNLARLNDLVFALCFNCKEMTDEERERIIYDAHDPIAREMATWWEEHQEADRLRREAEEAEKQRELDSKPVSLVERLFRELK